MKDIPIYCIHMYMSSLQKITMSNFAAQTVALQGHVLTLSDATLMRDRHAFVSVHMDLNRTRI